MPALEAAFLQPQRPVAGLPGCRCARRPAVLVDEALLLVNGSPDQSHMQNRSGEGSIKMADRRPHTSVVPIAVAFHCLTTT